MVTSPTTLVAYDDPQHFSPLLFSQTVETLAKVDELVGRTRGVVIAAHQLQGATHVATRDLLRELVRSMNSYYSNRIEGQGTHPLNIDRALKADFSAQPGVAQRQRIALAHIDAERALEQDLKGLVASEEVTLTSDFLAKAHRALYSRLSEGDRTTEDGHVVTPGEWRTDDVAVARHQPPTAASVPAFLAKMNQVYGRKAGLDQVLLRIACAHHRTAWVHPFRDGNGRAVRLQTHGALYSLTDGLWSVNRGLARQRDEYYTRLSNADMGRMGDRDGRGNLSERMLLEWCEFFIRVCEDQVSFMTKMLDLPSFKARLQTLMLVRNGTFGISEYRPELTAPLHYIFAAGPIQRGEFVQMTGMGERTARTSVSRLLKDGLLISPTPKGEVGLGLPLDMLSLLMPNLYPEASTLNPDPP
ncbi:MAG: Fic family protein [Paucibacter sp.]|nr:Fic family protein [Roseateles sp.]